MAISNLLNLCSPCISEFRERPVYYDGDPRDAPKIVTVRHCDVCNKCMETIRCVVRVVERLSVTEQ